MGRPALLAAAIGALGLAGCGAATHDTGTGPAQGAPTPVPHQGGVRARLTITYQPHNDLPRTVTWTLQCGPSGDGGSHPRPQPACAQLAAHHRLLTRVGLCPQFIIRGAPQAVIAGTLDGQRLHVTVTAACPVGALQAMPELLLGRSAVPRAHDAGATFPSGTG